jgi:hypothetical protein
VRQPREVADLQRARRQDLRFFSAVGASALRLLSFSVPDPGRTYGRLCFGPGVAGICLMCWRCLMEPANCAPSLGSLVQQRAAWETAEQELEGSRDEAHGRAAGGASACSTWAVGPWGGGKALGKKGETKLAEDVCNRKQLSNVVGKP